jgi:hypothetical protein
MTPRARSLPLPDDAAKAASPGQKGSGAPRIENAAVERRKARLADRKAGRLLSREQASRVRFAALCSLSFEGEREENRSRRGAETENQD